LRRSPRARRWRPRPIILETIGKATQASRARGEGRAASRSPKLENPGGAGRRALAWNIRVDPEHAGRGCGRGSIPVVAILIIQENSGTKSLRRHLLDAARIETRRVAADFGHKWFGSTGTGKSFAPCIETGASVRRDHQTKTGRGFKAIKNFQLGRMRVGRRLSPIRNRHIIKNTSRTAASASGWAMMKTGVPAG